jgi:shikimate 5-dehydrogenase
VSASTSARTSDAQPTFRVTSPLQSIDPAVVPTLYFIGVTTASSSIRRVFPAWAEHLGLGEGVQLVGIDLPIHADPAIYRSVVDFIKRDPWSVGALVTTHKLDLYAACHDLFDVIDPHAEAMEEVSCISKRGPLLVCHAKDPISSGLALDAFIPSGYFEQTGADVLCIGAGGSAIAISWYLTRAERGTDRPRRLVVTNRSEARLIHLAQVRAKMDADVQVETVLAPTVADTAAVLAELAPSSLVINATGLGKDAPGSPLPDDAVWPSDARAWDLNYRGDLKFLDQARANAESGVVPVDGWVYFLHGWTQVIAEVFHVDIPSSGPVFDELSRLASGQS